MADLLNAKEHYLELFDDLKQLREEERKLNGLKDDKKLLESRIKDTNKKYKKTRRLYKFFSCVYILTIAFEIFTTPFAVLLYSLIMVGISTSTIPFIISWNVVTILNIMFLSKKSGYNYLKKVKEDFISCFKDSKVENTTEFNQTKNEEKDKKISLKEIALGFLVIAFIPKEILLFWGAIWLGTIFFCLSIANIGWHIALFDLAKPNWMKKVEEKSRVLCVECQKIKIELEKLENLDKALEKIRAGIVRIEQEFQATQVNIEVMLGDKKAADIQVAQPVIEETAKMDFAEEQPTAEETSIDAGGTQLVFTK